jgi:hypothetical protein
MSQKTRLKLVNTDKFLYRKNKASSKDIFISPLGSQSVDFIRIQNTASQSRKGMPTTNKMTYSVRTTFGIWSSSSNGAFRNFKSVSS